MNRSMMNFPDLFEIGERIQMTQGQVLSLYYDTVNTLETKNNVDHKVAQQQAFNQLWNDFHDVETSIQAESEQQAQAA